MLKFLILNSTLLILSSIGNAGVGNSGGDIGSVANPFSDTRMGGGTNTSSSIPLKVNGPFDGTLVSLNPQSATIFQVNKDFKSPDYQMLGGSRSPIELLNQAYGMYKINPKNLGKLNNLLNKMGTNPTAMEIQELETLNFKIGFSGSKSFLIDGNSKYIVLLK